MIRTAAVLSTGDEILTGLTLDTNANFLVDHLFAAGVEPVAILGVGDRRERIRWAFEQALGAADVVISTGGLGPTSDDLTSEVLARTVGRELRFDEHVAERIRALFRSMDREMPENNLRQAYFPEGAVIVPNPRGTAAGYRLAVDWQGGRKHVVVLPGVPREMRAMFEETVLPWLREENAEGDVYFRHTFQTFGAAESTLDELLQGVLPEEEGLLAFRAAFPQLSVRVTVRASREDGERRLREVAEKVRERLGDYVFAEGDAKMEEVVQDLLRERGWTLAVAESCTGGFVANRITDVAGSSDVFVGGIVAYDPEVKVARLGVRRETIENHGLVSEQTAREMAEGARRVFAADVAVSTTGIAGPTGGTEETPVGTVCIALAAEGTLVSRRYQLRAGREWVKLLGSQVALDWVRRHVLGLSPGESLPLRTVTRKIDRKTEKQ